MPSALTLGADTLVAIDGDILGKPRDAAQAREYVARLAGRTHQVVGAIALARDGEITDTAVAITQVHFRAGNPGPARLVRRHGRVAGPSRRLRHPGPRRRPRRGIEGDYLNVVGLPLASLLDLLPDLLPT